MRSIAHISDLHFGHEEPAIVEGLLRELRAQAPSVVVVSGDLTQRAKSAQFAAARRFLDQLPAPYLVVPGNHDIPLYDLARRFLQPLTRYRRHITDDLSPIYRDAELAIFGINTAHALTIKDGRISRAQLDALRRELAGLPASLFKVIVTHHPFIAPAGDQDADLVDHAARALEVLDAGGVDLLLAGHLHKGFAGDVRNFHPKTRSMIAVQCGTSVSTRIRGEPNSYNLIQVARDSIQIEVRTWEADGFVLASRRVFAHKGEWREALTTVPAVGA